MLELISIHIPKTAGVSFQHLLREIYGEGLVTDYGAGQDLSAARVVHGHFPLGRYRPSYPETPVVTWLRDPVERIISYYFYWLHAAPHGNPNHDRFLAERPSLVEFAGQPAMQTEVARFLAPGDPADFLFVGFVERFEADVHRLRELMGWPLIDVPRMNVTERPEVPETTRRKLEDACSTEIEVYERMRAAFG
jgi:hypothetical protein